MHFVSKLMKRDVVDGTLTAQENQVAKRLWDLYIQSKHYSDVIKDVTERKRNNLACQLNLQLDDNHLLRFHGRYDNANLNPETRYSKLLPKSKYFTNLVIKDCQRECFTPEFLRP